MRLFKPLQASLALRYTFAGHSHRFATFVAILSILGIALGVCALITVYSVMQGMQERLKGALLSSTPHFFVSASEQDVSQLLALPHVIAAAPCIHAEVLLQTSSDMALVRLQGLDPMKIILNRGISQVMLKLPLLPSPGSFELTADSTLFNKYSLSAGSRVRLISTINASYTPVGLLPSRRIFTLTGYMPAISNNSGFSALGHYEDVRRLLRQKDNAGQIRLWLDDPFEVENTAAALSAAGFEFTDWRESRGDFFKAVAMERISMTVMLFLIVLVAAFNILSALSMMVSARLKEIAVLKSLGMSPGNILMIFMFSGLGCGLCGCLLGTLSGIALALNSDTLTRMLGMSAISIPAVLKPLPVLCIILGSLLLSLLCTIYPALKAASADPARSLFQS